MLISLIAALDRNGIIGKDNALPWHLPNDLKHFRELTRGKPVIMGRKTYESIGRALPDRANIILTRDLQYVAPGCAIVHSMEDALRAAGTVEEVMVIGGAEIFRLFLPRAKKLYLTFIDATFEGATYFPDWNPSEWREVERDERQPDQENPYHYAFVILERKEL